MSTLGSGGNHRPYSFRGLTFENQVLKKQELEVNTEIHYFFQTLVNFNKQHLVKKFGHRL